MSNVKLKAQLEREILSLLRDRGSEYEATLIEEVMHSNSFIEYGRCLGVIYKLADKGLLQYAKTHRGNLISNMATRH